MHLEELSEITKPKGRRIYVFAYQALFSGLRIDEIVELGPHKMKCLEVFSQYG